MKIHVKTSNGTTFYLYLSTSESIIQVKNKIKEKTGIPLDKQILLCNGLKLEGDDKTFIDFDIEEETIILVIEKEENDVVQIYNPKLNLLPNIALCIDYDCKIDEQLYDNLKKELSEIIDKNNFSIIELKKGSTIMTIALIGDLALKGIKASEYNKSSDEINNILKKIESKQFVCLGNNYTYGAKYKIPDYSKNENRNELVKFLKETSKDNEDILQTSSTITNAEFDKILEETIKSVTDKVVLQEINQKKYILNKLEEFNNQIESILEKSKMNGIFEFSIVGLSLINRKDMEKYKDCKNKCDNLETKFLFHGTSTEISSLIITTDFRSGDASIFWPWNIYD